MIICGAGGPIVGGGENVIDVETYVGGHRGNEDDTTSALRNHVPGSFARSEERAVNVDIVQTLYPIEGIVERGVVFNDT